MKRLYYLIKFYLRDRKRCVHQFEMRRWMDLNGDPKCIHCGDFFLDKIMKQQPPPYFEVVQTGESLLTWKPKRRK